MPASLQRTSESKDYHTGYRTITQDLDVPDRQPHEPYGIRAQAKETGTNQWSINVHHGPHEERDESGSYYRHISSDQFTGPLGKLKPQLRRAVSEQWKGVQRARR
jgi:hypothetical protein